MLIEDLYSMSSITYLDVFFGEPAIFSICRIDRREGVAGRLLGLFAASGRACTIFLSEYCVIKLWISSTVFPSEVDSVAVAFTNGFYIRTQRTLIPNVRDI